MNIYFVTGFLGSGKTSSIIQASRLLMGRGMRVGVVTNDQGRYLVDQHFVAAEGIRAESVAGGCFCCNYDEFEKHVLSLERSAQPDVVFAESVGSCTDVVATVVKPLLDMRSKFGGSVSTFVDARLLERRLSGYPLPFSDNINYIFDKQLEESEVLVVNKRDLLAPGRDLALLELVADAYPSARIVLHCAHREEDVAEWLSAAQDARTLVRGPSMTVDYDRYGAGEAELAWLDAEMVLEGHDVFGRLQKAMDAFVAEVRHRTYPVGHIKVFARAPESTAKISVVSLEDAEGERFPPIAVSRVELTFNARVQTTPEALTEVFDSCFLPELADLIGDHRVQAFAPAYPQPTHRRD